MCFSDPTGHLPHPLRPGPCHFLCGLHTLGFDSRQVNPSFSTASSGIRSADIQTWYHESPLPQLAIRPQRRFPIQFFHIYHQVTRFQFEGYPTGTGFLLQSVTFLPMPENPSAKKHSIRVWMGPTLASDPVVNNRSASEFAPL